MNSNFTVIPVQITSDSIKKKFKTSEPVRAIFELIWNGLDANAKLVSVKTKINNMHGLDLVSVEDDGRGINFEEGENCDFIKFDDSSKKSDIDTHGKDGIGRFSYHKLSNRAEWYTKHNGKAFKAISYESNLHELEFGPIEESDLPSFLNENSGTVVYLSDFNSKNGGLPAKNRTLKLLSEEFGWFLAYRQDTKILFDGIKVSVPEHTLREKSIEIDDFEFNITLFHWLVKPTSVKSYIYYTNKNNKVVHKQLSRTNNKTGFYTSVVVSSTFNDSFDKDLFEMDGSKDILNKVSKTIHQMQSELYKDFLREQADSLINKYEEKGFFNSVNKADSEIDRWRMENTKKIVKELYITDPTIFNNLNDKPARILVRLLDRVLVSNENDALWDILEGVLDLDSEHVERFASLIHNTKLENIISTVEVISKRLQTIKMLRKIMVDDYKSILETPDLQQVIEANSWLFGEQYSILGAEEDDFNKTAKKLRDAVHGINDLTTEDVEGSMVEGSKRQVDLFLARKKMSYDERNNKIYKCVIIEIKRPSISLNKKHLRQLEDYAEIIQKSSEFGISEKLRFDLILVGRKISAQDTSIQGKLESMTPHHEKGLVSISDNRRIKSYVKDWFSLLDEHELSSEYILEKLKPKLPDYSVETSEDIVEKLQNSA